MAILIFRKRRDKKHKAGNLRIYRPDAALMKSAGIRLGAERIEER
jgi:hypothetical protein